MINDIQETMRRRACLEISQETFKARTALHEVFDQYRYAGIADTEGRAEVCWWLERQLSGKPVSPITFQALQGYVDYRPDSSRGQATKQQIAAQIRHAAQALLTGIKKAAKVRGYRVPMDDLWVISRLSDVI